jgi:transcriptional regulator with XRE-family HTH domain
MHTSNLPKMIAMRLRELMDASLDLRTQAAVAKRSGVDQSTIGRILNQQNKTTIGTLESIAGAFNVEPLELIVSKPSSNALSEWQRLIDKLPPTERDRIIQFIRFTIDQSQLTLNKETLNSTTTSEPLPPAIEGSALMAAKRSVTTNREKSLTYEKKAGATNKTKSFQPKQ